MTPTSNKTLWSPKLHKWLGITLLVPLCVWAITGAIFLVKPGYDRAYEKLAIKTYAKIHEALEFQDQQVSRQWQQYRRLNTVVGEHLLVQRDDQWLQLDVTTGLSRLPTDFEVRQLLEDAFSRNPERYGKIERLTGLEAVTDTQVVVTLNWDKMTLRQRGSDTRLIQWLYRMHYLQWSGHERLDRILGFAGLFLLIALTVLGIRLLFLKTPSK